MSVCVHRNACCDCVSASLMKVTNEVNELAENGETNLTREKKTHSHRNVMTVH